MTLRHCKRVHIAVLVVPKRGGVLRTPSSDTPQIWGGQKGVFARLTQGDRTIMVLDQNRWDRYLSRDGECKATNHSRTRARQPEKPINACGGTGATTS